MIYFIRRKFPVLKHITYKHLQGVAARFEKKNFRKRFWGQYKQKITYK